MTPGVCRIARGPWGSNCYAVHTAGMALIVDPGGDPSEVLTVLSDRTLVPIGMVATHGHFDHVAAAAGITDATGLPLWISGADQRILAAGNLHSLATGHGQPVVRPVVLEDLDDVGDTVEFGPITVTVIATPGHTPGSCCLLVGDALFTGDTLMARGAVDSPLPGADPVGLRDSLLLLATTLDSSRVTIYPGHGPSCGLAEALAAADADGHR